MRMPQKIQECELVTSLLLPDRSGFYGNEIPETELSVWHVGAAFVFVTMLLLCLILGNEC